MNKIFLVSMMAAGTAFAVPRVSNVSQEATDGNVTVTYELDAPAVVTFSVEAKSADGVWTKVGGEATANYAGDVNRLVTPTQDVNNAFTWFPGKSWPVRVADGSVRVSVKAWATNAPPDYMVVNLQVAKRVEYFETAEAIPGGVGDRVYKSNRLVMRRIPAAGAMFRMGSCYTERSSSNYGKPTGETPHDVTFTEDFYLGIYELTYLQYRAVSLGLYYNGTWDSSDPTTYLRPVTGFSRYGNNSSESALLKLRGKTYTGADDLHDVSSGSVIDVFRQRTGVAFDLPTEFQWEFACRAGSEDIYYDGSACPTNVAWASYTDQGLERPTSTQEVGLLKPNAWGLYDMLGNVSEMCLNAWNGGAALSDEPESDPIGVGGTQLIYRGGSWCQSGAKVSRCAFRSGISTSWSDNGQVHEMGIRLWAPAVAAQ